MARIRTVKPEFFLNEELAELPFQYRLLFIGLFNQADRSGRIIDRPKRLKVEIFPYDNVDVDKGLTALQDAGFILRYKTDEENPMALIQVLTFDKHQKIDKTNEKESILPPPREIDYSKSINRLPIVGEGKGKEGKGKEYIDRFLEFWEMYGKREKKAEAKKKFEKLEDSEIEKIFLTLPAFLQEHKELKFRPYPITYLNQRRWEDELKPAKKIPQPQEDNQW